MYKGGIILDKELLVRLVTKVVMELIHSGEINLTAKEDGSASSPKNSPVFNCKGKRVVCLDDLRGMEPGVFEVDRNTIITPLAKDYAKEKRIEICFRG